MQLRKLPLALLIMSTSLQTLNAYVYEYKKLYRSKTGTTIDLLYDIHIAVPSLTITQFLALDYNRAISKLYPTEQKVLSVLKELDKKGSSCDLIWETATSERFKLSPRIPCFIGLDNFFGLNKFQNIRFIAADKHRNCGFNSLFLVKEGRNERVGYNLTGCSFDNPAPITATMTQAIEFVSGPLTLQRYTTFRSVELEKIKNYFRRAYYYKQALDYTKDIYENDIFHSLCDIEMLSHILSSKASRIIVYAGGWHCNNIAKFLEKADFRVVNHERDVYKQELPAYLLTPLEINKVSVPVPLTSVSPSRGLFAYFFRKGSYLNP